MANPEVEELKDYIEQLIDGTREGTFDWKSINPSTYVWQRQDQNRFGARLTLQKITEAKMLRTPGGLRPTSKRSFNLQVAEIEGTGPGVEQLRISGKDDEVLNDKLRDLYELISSGVTRKGLRFFRDVLNRH